MPTVAPLDIDGHVLAVEFLRDTPFFAAASGTIHRLQGGEKVTEAHQGMLTCIRDPHSDSLISGGEDGKVVRTGADGEVTTLAEVPRKWITQLAAGPQGAVAYAYSKSTFVRLADGTTKEFAEERTVEGLAFAPKGLRIAVARYNGVSLHWVGMSAAPVDLEWKGAHTGVTFSPDGQFLVTTMQENALHGWKLDTKQNAEARHMRMTGYPSKVKSLSWSAKGKWLASSGAPAAIVWPFQGKDGPMGKAPLELGTRANIMATSVKFHPAEDILAIGFVDGMVLAVRLADSKEALLRRPGKGAITSMAWSKSGKQLAFASEAGDCGVIDISAWGQRMVPGSAKADSIENTDIAVDADKGMTTAGLVWDRLRIEAVDLAGRERLLRPLLGEQIIASGTNADMLAGILATRLSTAGMSGGDLLDLFRDVLKHNPGIVVGTEADLVAVRTRDPACTTYLHAFLNLKGFHALQTHRIAHALWIEGRVEMASWLSNLASLVFGPDIHPAASLGSGIMLDHGSGIVIGETAVIEDEVSILQNVTLGGTGKETGDRHPKIRQGVMIGAGAKILGNIEIGAFSKVAAGSVVVKPVPAHCTVAGVPASVVRIHRADEIPAETMDQNI